MSGCVLGKRRRRSVSPEKKGVNQQGEKKDNGEKEFFPFLLLPVELRLSIAEELPAVTMTSLRRTSRGMEKMMRGARGRRRRVEAVTIEGDEDGSISLSFVCKEEKKKRKWRMPPGDWRDDDCSPSAKKKLRHLSIDDVTTSPRVFDQFIDRFSRIVTGSDVTRLELIELSLTVCTLPTLTDSIREAGCSVHSISISMTSFSEISPQDLISFLHNVSPRIVRLSWIRDATASHLTAIASFLEGREAIEVVNVTDSQGSLLLAPLCPLRLLAAGCSSFHLDSAPLGHAPSPPIHNNDNNNNNNNNNEGENKLSGENHVINSICKAARLYPIGSIRLEMENLNRESWRQFQRDDVTISIDSEGISISGKVK